MAKRAPKPKASKFPRNRFGRRIISVPERRARRKRMLTRVQLSRRTPRIPGHGNEKAWMEKKGPFFQPWHTTSSPFRGIVGGKKRSEMLSEVRKARASGLRGHAAATAAWHGYMGSRRKRVNEHLAKASVTNQRRHRLFKRLLRRGK